ncbi:GspE/PulE family protein [Pseudoalteromonas denitrificans]|uniref:Type II secretory pathway ATPase GspE/PulE or T4P pilus assembly pathway ATPase PilB n=1 Tax=Pseudoalteromonas denitrificans DSM 6059 TaxID=1123010 RepID=A0A1I1K2A7_9GAMM|nr:GspE/PulE family protein [Pseudoalteromonas denitrificans]SFC54984.1 Type II secretory pathway ATPase GspE/PulE or T4P pilus assembly pathway ATPase PilB [Pseudoalteromonas denitrificans DSM 6059]
MAFFYQELTAIFTQIHASHHFSDALPLIESKILSLFKAQRLTIYQRNKFNQEIVSRFKSGTELTEIKVNITPHSLAGYVAMSKKPLLIRDAYSDEELLAIHPKLKFAKQFDQTSNFRTKSVLTIPIIADNVLLGIMQLINKIDLSEFDKEDAIKAIEFANIIGQKFRYELGGSKAPFDLLLLKNLITEQQLQTLNKESQYSLQIKMLQESFSISDKEIGLSLEAYYQVPLMAQYDERFHLHTLNNKLNLEYLKKNMVVIIADANELSTLLMTKPNNADLIMEIESATGLEEYKVQVCLPDIILQYLGDNSTSSSGLDEINDILDEFGEQGNEDDITTEDSVSEDAPAVVKLVNRILQDAKNHGASDIHIDPNKGKIPTKVRIRVDGICRDLIEIPANHLQAMVARIKIISRLDIAEKRLPQDGKFTVKLNNVGTEIRVATIPTVNGESVVMRILASGAALPFDKLRLSPRNSDMLKFMSNTPHGLLLVVGPTGSGKTTTLHAVLGLLNTPDKKIWTAEDPVEITQAGLNQVQMNNKLGFKFETALRAFLRADPDIILIGEMRDLETAAAGIEASLTGHLVLSTLHTNSAPETITRLIDIGLDPINFADACIGILAQRLMRTLCPDCKTPYNAKNEEKEFIIRHYSQNLSKEDALKELNINDACKLYKATGCEKCDQTGYKGRVGVHELLPVNTEIKNLIYRNAPVGEIKLEAIRAGMRTLTQDGILKVLSGLTDFKQLQSISNLK